MWVELLVLSDFGFGFGLGGLYDFLGRGWGVKSLGGLRRSFGGWGFGGDWGVGF